MSWPGRLWAGDEELGKKDDDHRPSNGVSQSTAWSVRKPQALPRRRRIIYALCAALFLYLFIKNIPTDLGSNALRADSRVYQPPKSPQESTILPSPGKITPLSSGKKPPRPKTPSEAEEHYHDGPIKFYKLAASLHAVAKLGGQKEKNKNVLFAASNLKSVSELLPLACEMARFERNDVHIAIMGRDEIEIQEIRAINGISDDCTVHWHDARPDFSRWSSEFRMEVSVTASLEHIQTFIHPQVIIVDDPGREDDFFTTALRSKAVDMKQSVMELPEDAARNMMWITRLDSAALAALPRIYVDILIQATPSSSESLIRLMKSIQEADYFGARRPHLTIELSAAIDTTTWRYLENLVWPPLDWSGEPHASQVTLRHRIPRKTTTVEEASARLVESFYPVRTKHSHVLLLSPQVELSPLYYQYLMYNLLEYKYSKASSTKKETANLIGISLELPSTQLDDISPLEPPPPNLPKSDESADEETAFLWQAPNSNAALYFGDKWMEFHSFYMGRISKPPTSFPKVVSEKHPSWLEYALELMRARGYAMLYPNFNSEDGALATVHEELYEIPEEFLKEKPSSDMSAPPLSPEDALEADPSLRPSKVKGPPVTERALLTSTLLDLLPQSGELPALMYLPILTIDAKPITLEAMGHSAQVFSDTFRHQTGSCGPNEVPPEYVTNSANDLFCHLDYVFDHHAVKNPPGGSSTTNPHHDEDAIHPDHHRSAQDEASSHLDRQNTPPPSGGQGPNRPPRNPAPVKQKEDSDEEIQNEFRKQIERQSRQASGGKGHANMESKKEEQPASGEGNKDEIKEERQDDKKDEKQGEKKDEREEPKHDTPNVEPPKEPNEGTADDKEKSPGW